MKLTSQEEYGVRCMMQLASASPEGPVKVADVAEGAGLSLDYAGKLLHRLRCAGLVHSVQGRGGGFVLARPSYAITLADILKVFSNGLFGDGFCNCYPGSRSECVHLDSCALRPVWWGLSRLIDCALGGISLLDLTVGEEQMCAHVGARFGFDARPRVHSLEPPADVDGD